MQHMKPGAPQLVFVGGLHRSGTSLLARCIGEHPDVSVFRNTGVPEDEGQHLQDVYPTAAAHGGPGRFGFVPEAHLTEASTLAAPSSASRLFDQWLKYWDVSKPILLEKSPPNLIRARFLQALFPDAAFVMVIRHPVAVSLATERWCQTSEVDLLEHWIRCHELFRQDEPHLRKVLMVRYEDFVGDPTKELMRIWHFLNLNPHPVAADIARDVNAAYFDRWQHRHSGVRGWWRLLLLRRRFEERIAQFGYRLADFDKRG